MFCIPCFGNVASKLPVKTADLTLVCRDQDWILRWWDALVLRSKWTHHASTMLGCNRVNVEDSKTKMRTMAARLANACSLVTQTAFLLDSSSKQLASRYLSGTGGIQATVRPSIVAGCPSRTSSPDVGRESSRLEEGNHDQLI